MHVFVNHIHEFMDLIGTNININDFSLQGLEKLNDLVTQYYFRSTNRNTSESKFLKQLIQKRVRVESLHLI